MMEWLRKLKLVRDFDFTINADGENFPRKFSAAVDRGGTGFFSNFSDIFSSSANLYKGEVNGRRFSIKKKAKFFQQNLNMATAVGTFSSERDTIRFQGTVSSLTWKAIPFLVFILLFYGAFLGVFVLGGLGEDVPAFVLIFLLVHAAFMIGIPYVIIRKSVSSLISDFERDLYYIAR